MNDIGIDLGTTYSCVMHCLPDGQEQIVPTAEGGELTPSVVYFDEDESVVVGGQAKGMLAKDPDNVVVGIKRHMGEDYPLEFHGKKFTPEAISGIVLKRLALDAAEFFHVDRSLLQAVITVPAYFGVAEKEATYAAARIAELTCLELLAEPVAAAYAYGADPNVNDSSLVFDLGGGTFDVAIVGMVSGQPKIWAVDGETQLGGLDWDRRLNDVLWDRLVTQGIDEDAIFDEEFTGALMREAELLKRNLSVHDSGTARLSFGGKTYSVSVTRDVFEEVTKDLVAQCMAAAHRVVSTAGSLGARPISRVLLVGGSTRMMMIRRGMESEFGVPVLIHDPDKAVARGAAILASKLSQKPGGIALASSQVKRITPVLPKGIGIKVYSSQLPPRPEPYVMNILPANTPLPVSGKDVTVATIVKDQDTARIELYEQAGSTLSERIGDNRLLFDGQISGIPAGPAGSPIALTIVVEIDGRISVSAAMGKTRVPLNLEAFIHGVIDEQEFDEQASNVSSLIMAR